MAESSAIPNVSQGIPLSVVDGVFKPLENDTEVDELGIHNTIVTDFFEGISVRKARVRYENQISGVTLFADRVDLDVTRTRDGIDVDFMADFSSGR